MMLVNYIYLCLSRSSYFCLEIFLNEYGGGGGGEAEGMFSVI